MLSKTKSFGLVGINGYEIEIEVDINFGMPKFDIVGLPDTGVKESRDRIKGALKNSGFDYPISHITVNMAPADTKKEGPIYDLAIATGILVSTGQLHAGKTNNKNDEFTNQNGGFNNSNDVNEIAAALESVKVNQANLSNQSNQISQNNGGDNVDGGNQGNQSNQTIQDGGNNVGNQGGGNQPKRQNVSEFAFIGELSLDGGIRRVNGVLPLLITAKELGYKKIIVPAGNKSEAGVLGDIEVYAFDDLRKMVKFLSGREAASPIEQTVFTNKKENKGGHDFKFVSGQMAAKRALEIAAAGNHNVIMIGPPGSGKTMLANCMPSILPDLTFEEALETTKIHSIAGLLNDEGIITTRPIRKPHHTASTISLSGGGAKAKPGEISLAHNGILFLDELPEYQRAALETLRQPLEDGVISVARAAISVEYPADFILIASMNPCPCGHYGSKKQRCKCNPKQIQTYLNKLSGPLMDRIDMHIEVDGVEFSQLSSKSHAEESSEIKKRVDAARLIQLERYKGSKVYSNSKMTVGQSKKHCELNEQCEGLLKAAFEKMNLSARAYNRIIKVARTIADLDGSLKIEVPHIAEAISYRSLDSKYSV